MIGIFFRGIIFLFVMAWYTVGIFQVIDNYFRDEVKKQINIQSNKPTDLKQPTVVTDPHVNKFYIDPQSQCEHVMYNDGDEGGSEIKEQHRNGMQFDNMEGGFYSQSCEVQSASNANAVTESERISARHTQCDNGKDGHCVTGSDRTCINSVAYGRP